VQPILLKIIAKTSSCCKLIALMLLNNLDILMFRKVLSFFVCNCIISGAVENLKKLRSPNFRVFLGFLEKKLKNPDF